MPAPTTHGHCAADEQLLFSAPLADKPGKIVSICGSKDLGEGTGYLQYRFGAPGAVELEFPASRDGSRGAFTYSRHTGPQVTYLAVAFENEGHKYEIYDDFNYGETARGIRITPPGKDPIELALGEPEGSLMKLEGVVPEVPAE